MVRTVYFAFVADGFVFFRCLEPESWSSSPGEGNARFIADTGSFPVVFRDIFPVFRDAVVVSERFIDGGECGEPDEAEGEEDECADTDKENRGHSLATEPASGIVGRARRIVGRTEVWEGECVCVCVCVDRKSTRLHSSHRSLSRMPSSS